MKQQLKRDLPQECVAGIAIVFEKDVRRCVDLLRRTAASGDADSYARVAHSLAGAAAAVGATSLEWSARLAMREAKVHCSPGALTAALQCVVHEAEGTLAALPDIVAVRQ